MKIKSCSSLRLFKALIATVLLVLGCHQAAAQLDPVAQHQDRPVDGPNRVIAELPGAWCAKT
jgi:hypothetical protein